MLALDSGISFPLPTAAGVVAFMIGREIAGSSYARVGPHARHGMPFYLPAALGHLLGPPIASGVFG